MKREGNRGRSEAVNASNCIIDILSHGSNNLKDKVVEKVREKVTTVLLFNSKPAVHQVIKNDENVFALILNAISKSVSQETYALLNYNGISYKTLKYGDLNHDVEIETEISEEKEENKPNSTELLDKTILPIREGVININKYVTNFISKGIQFDIKKYSSIFKSGLANIDKIIQFLSAKKADKNSQSTCKDVVKNAEQSIIHAAKDPFHRALRKVCEIMRRKIKHGSQNISKSFYNKDTEKKMREELYKTENTSVSLHDFARNFQRKSGYLNMDQDLRDDEKLF